jgi:hypothetical protein
MSAPTEDVDRTAVDRRGRRLAWWSLPLVPGWFAAIVPGRHVSSSRRTGW